MKHRLGKRCNWAEETSSSRNLRLLLSRHPYLILLPHTAGIGISQLDVSFVFIVSFGLTTLNHYGQSAARIEIESSKASMTVQISTMGYDRHFEALSQRCLRW